MPKFKRVCIVMDFLPNDLPCLLKYKDNKLVWWQKKNRTDLIFSPVMEFSSWAQLANEFNPEFAYWVKKQLVADSSSSENIKSAFDEQVKWREENELAEQIRLTAQQLNCLLEEAEECGLEVTIDNPPVLADRLDLTIKKSI